LHECLETVTRLMAPFVPFITDEVHERLVRDVTDGAGDSVHLQTWPQPEPGAIDPALGAQMALVRRAVELGRSARAGSSVRTRQPLSRALVSAAGWSDLPGELKQHVADELNVRSLDALTSAGDLVDVSVKPNFRSLGRRFGPRTPTVAAAVAAAPAAELVAATRGGSGTVLVDGDELALLEEDLLVTESPRSGCAVASAGAETVALDLELTDELRRAGTVREVVRLVQDTRKAQGLDVTDRVELWWEAAGETALALRESTDLLAGEVLAVSVKEGPPAAPLSPHTAADLGLTFWLRPVG
jgi:isoleucyl-tRNA synthetase